MLSFRLPLSTWDVIDICVRCVCVHVYSHTIKSTCLLLLTILKCCVLSKKKKAIGYFKIRGVHKVHVCVVVNSFNSFVSFPESVENS